MSKSSDWIRTARSAVQDVARLGLDGAVAYQLDLMRTDNDEDWRAAGEVATADEMREAILAVVAEACDATKSRGLTTIRAANNALAARGARWSCES